MSVVLSSSLAQLLQKQCHKHGETFLGYIYIDDMYLLQRSKWKW